MKVIKGLNDSIKDFDGVEYKENDIVIFIKRLLSNSLANTQSSDPIRMMDVALKIHNAEDQIELEDADFNEVKSAVENNKRLFNAFKAPLLQILKNVEEVKK